MPFVAQLATNANQRFLAIFDLRSLIVERVSIAA